MAEADPEPQWKKLKLSFERPYKDDSGHPIPVLYDLTPEGQSIYEPYAPICLSYINVIQIESLPSKETSSARLAINLRRVFQERGTDFFDRDENAGFGKSENVADAVHQGSSVEDTSPSEDSVPKVMTMEELYNMKLEILPQLL